MTFPFPYYPPLAKGLVLIDRTAGSNFGNMTARGGLAAAFDGVTNQDSVAAANNTNDVNSWIGKTLPKPRVFGRAIAYGSNNQGFKTGNSNPSMWMRIRGKNGDAPTSITAGTALGIVEFTDTNNESAGRVIESTDLVTAWDHLWITIEGGSEGGNNALAELQLFAWEYR